MIIIICVHQINIKANQLKKEIIQRQNLKLNHQNFITNAYTQMSTDIVMQPEPFTNQNLHKFKQIQTQLQSSIHEHKKALLQAKSELDYERTRANEFQQKYKNAIRYQNEEIQLKKIMNELNQKLKTQENQMLELLKSEQDKKLKIHQLQNDNDEIKTTQDETQQKLRQIQQAAVAAIMQKDTIIAELQEKLQLIEIDESSNSSNLNVALMQLQEKYKQLEQRSQATKNELESMLEQRQEDIRQLEQKAEHHKEKLEERISRMEQEIQDYEKHIEHINEEKNQEENLQEKYYLIEEKLRKSEKRNSELELLLTDLKKQYEEFLAKFTLQQDQIKNLHDEIKSFKLKLKQLNSEIKDKEKTNSEQKIQHQKTVNELNKKLALLQNDKKKTHEAIDTKNIEIQRLRLEIDQKIAELSQQKSRKNTIDSSKNLTDSRVSLAAQIKHVNTQKLISPAKMAKKQSQQHSRAIEKYKQQISDLEENNALLNKKLQERTKEIQELRQRLVAESGSASRSEEEAKLLCVIEDLNNHIKKLENSMITEKYKYAEDENFWKMKEKNYKVEMDSLMKQFKKERSELLERIDRMKKSVAGKDKKMDYYQSAFK